MIRVALIIVFALIFVSFTAVPSMADKTVGFSRGYHFGKFYHYYKRGLHHPRHFYHRGYHPYSYFPWYFATPYQPYRFYPYYAPTYPYPPGYYYYPFGYLRFGFTFGK